MNALTEQIVAELSGGASARHVKTSCAFGIDEAQARALLSALRLEDPRHYVLELVQAVSLLGASALSIEITPLTMRMRCDGAAFEARELQELYAAAFRPRQRPRDEALRHLALALGSAQALDPSSIEIESFHGEGGHRLRVRRRARDELRERPASRSSRSLHVTIAQRPALRHAGALWHHLRGRQLEVELLRERARFASLAIVVNQERVSRGLRLEAPCDERVSWEQPRSCGVLGVTLGPGEGVVHWVRHGVIVTSQITRYEGFVVHGVIRADDLKLDLALGDVVRDATWERLQREALLDQACRALNRLLAARPDAARAVAPTVWRLVPRRSLRPGASHTRALLERLERLPIFPAADAVARANRWDRA